MGILLAAMLILIPPQQHPVVTEIEGNVITLEGGTETTDWFLIDDNELVM